MKRLTLLIMLLASLLFGINVAHASTASTQDCITCHGSTVADFNQPNVAKVDKMRCYQCHSQGLHTRSYNGMNIVIIPFIDPVTGTPNEAYFLKNPDTVTIAEYHALHSTPDPRAAACTECHISLTCKSCHQTIPHGNHSSSKYPQSSYFMTSGVFGSPEDYINSCATSQCHGQFNTSYQPVKVNADGSQLCLNCHNKDKTGHSETELAGAHTTTLSNSLMLQGQQYNVNCMQCHDSALSTEHTSRGVSCSTCHATSASIEIQAVVKTAEGDPAKKACEKCHFNLLVLPLRAAEHPLAHKATKSNDLDIVGGPHANCNTCHERAEIAGTIKTLAFSNPKDYSCLDCHSGGTSPKAPKHFADYNGQSMDVTSVHTCSACHTPGTDAAAKVNSLAATLKADPNASYSCTECHTDMQAGHKASFGGTLYNDTTKFHLQCTDCHNATYKPTIDTLKGLVKLGQGYECSECHLLTGVKGDTPYYPVHKAGEDSIVGFHPNSCDSCHGVINNLYKVNLDTIRDKVANTGYECTDCHNGSVAQVPLHTAKDDKGAEYITTNLHPTCGTCHNSTDANVRSVITTQRGTTTPYNCAECHVGIAPKHSAKWNGTALETTQFHQDCAQCHGNNSELGAKIHGIKVALKSGTIIDYNCTDCHGATSVGGSVYAPAAVHRSGFDVDGAVYETTIFHAKLGTGEQACFACHTNAAVEDDFTAIVVKVKAGSQYKCTDCHNNTGSAPYQPNHSAALGSEQFSVVNEHPACTTCHTTAKDATIATLKGTSGYSCEACHTNLEAKHQSTTNLSDPNYMVNCSWCHSSTDPAFATNNLIGVHVKPSVTLSKQYTCNVCHSATSPVKNQIANHQTACDVCHNGASAPMSHPDSQFYPKHVVSTFPTFMAEYSPNCSTCHTDMSIINLHAPQYVGCKSCHSDNVVYQPVVSSLNTDCSNCHNATINPAMDMESAHKPFHNADTTKYPATAECLNCHKVDDTTEGTSLLGVHKKASDSTVTCDTCHGVTVRQAVKDAIATNNVSCQACHGASGGGHAHPVATFETTPEVNCARCHSTGTDGSTELSKLHADKGVACASCHNATFEGGANPVIVKDGTFNVPTCSTCHDGTKVDPGHSATVLAGQHAVKSYLNNSTDNSCTTCHSTDVKVTHSEIGCNACHGDTAPAWATSVINANLSTNTTIPGFTCQDCHTNIAGGHAHPIAVNGYDATNSNTCKSCHAINTDGTAELAKIHQNAADAGKIANYSCATCHNSTFEGATNIIRKDGTIDMKQNGGAVIYCASCHNGTLVTLNHAAEHTATSDDASNLNCASCHNGTSWTGNDAKVEGVHNNNCNTCHTSTNTVVKNVIAAKKGLANPVYKCEECHVTNGAPTKEAKHMAEHSAAHSATGMTCSSCHSFNLAANVATDIKSTTIHKNGCNTCHGASTRNDVKLFIASMVGKTNATYGCEACHGTIHQGWDAKHTPTFPTNLGMDCSSCHANYLPNEHEKALTSTANTTIGYKVFRSTTSTGPWTEIGSTTATSFANGGLAANTTYYYKVQAYDGKPNLSDFSNAINVTTLASTPVAVVKDPDLARYVSGSNGDSSADPASTSDYLSKLTDDSTSTYATVRENGSSDQYIFVKNNLDAANYSKVQLKLSVRYYYGTTSLAIYPYSGDTTINTSAKVVGPTRSKSYSYTTETIDVTNAAKTMNGKGWMKFRIKPNTSATAYIAKVELVLTQAATSGGTPTNPSGTIPANANDTSVPSEPSNLAGTANYYDRVDLTWTAATDSLGVQGDVCAVCHASTAPQQAKDAITAKNANCSACHTIHANIDTAHAAPSFGFITYSWDCAKCHTTALHTEHANRGLNCDTCHKSGKAKVSAAIKSSVTDGSNKKCDVCHTGTTDGAGAIHTDVTAPHLTGIFPTATDATCLGCHNTEKAEFVSTMGALHLVQISGITSKASGKGSYLSPWTYTSTVGCQGCHGASTVGGTTANANILKKPYTYTSTASQTDMLCFMCHNRSSYGGGSESAASGFSQSGKNLHNIGDHESSRIQCSWCHASKPHSTTTAHLVTTTGKPNSQGNVLTSYTHPASGSYSVSSCGSNVSACDEHR